MGTKKFIKQAAKGKAALPVPETSKVTYHGRGGRDKQAIVLDAPGASSELSGGERDLLVFSPSSGTPSFRNAVPAGETPGTYSA